MGSIRVTKIWRTCFHRPHNGHRQWCSGHLVRKRGKSAMHPSLLWHLQQHPPPAQPIAFPCSCKYSIVGNSVTCLWSKFNDPTKKDNTRSQHQPYTETFVHKLTFIPNSTGPHLWCHPKTYFRKHHGHSSTSTFFWVNFYHLLTKTNSVWLLKRIFGEKMRQFARLSRIVFPLKLPYFGWNPWRIGSSRSPKYSRVLNFFLLFSLTCSQIGLIPLVHAHQCGYITKL